MKTHTLLFTLLAAISTTAAASEAASIPRPLGLTEMVTHLESTYGGEVIAIALDASGDKRPHYHVGLRYPHAGLASVDVDAVSREISAHDSSRAPGGSATLPEVAALLATQLPGELTIVELDTSDGARPHYDVDVRVGSGKTARLKVDAATRSIGWRQPAVVDD